MAPEGISPAPNEAWRTTTDGRSILLICIYWCQADRVNDRAARHKSPYPENPSKQPSGFVYSIPPRGLTSLFRLKVIHNHCGICRRTPQADHPQPIHRATTRVALWMGCG